MEYTHEQILEELKNNPKVQAFTAAYDEGSIPFFLQEYVKTKLMLLTEGEKWREQQLHADEYYRAKAEEYYWHIATKKLFNAQCLWLADRLELPIEITNEFTYWFKNVKICPFIEDTTEVEIECMLSYLAQAPHDHEKDDPNLHDLYKPNYYKDEETGIGAGDEYPPWFHWYDTHIGPANIMALPNLKGAKEERYLNAARNANALDSATVKKTKPRLYLSDMDTFVEQTENYKMIEFYKLHKQRLNKRDVWFDLEYEIDLMLDEPQEVWIPNGRFPDAIFKAAHLLKVAKLKKLLPQIHQEHVERKAMGISYQEEEVPMHYKAVDIIKNAIKRGKDILGEE